MKFKKNFVNNINVFLQNGCERWVRSALTNGWFLFSLVPQLHAAALTQLLQSHGFVALQSISQGQKDGVNMLLLSRVLGWSLKQWVIVAVCKTLCCWGGDLPALLQVTLVAHHDARHHPPHGVAAALVNPLGDALEGGEAGHIVNKDDSMDTAVVMLHHASSETLLTCSVPDLQLVQNRTRVSNAIRECIFKSFCCWY